MVYSSAGGVTEKKIPSGIDGALRFIPLKATQTKSADEKMFDTGNPDDFEILDPCNSTWPSTRMPKS